MGKAPAFQFYVRDWLSDPQLRMASLTTRGIWIDLLCFMWDAPDRGEIKSTLDKIARMVGASNGDLTLFLEEAQALRFCYAVTDDNKNITVRNRRMHREANEKNNNRLRQKRFRDKQKSNAEVTPLSSTASSTASVKIKKLNKKDRLKAAEIYDFYIDKIGPVQKSKQRAIENISSHLNEFLFENLKQSILNYKTITFERDPNYRKDPANFFSKREKFFVDYLPDNFQLPEGNQDDVFRRLREKYKDDPSVVPKNTNERSA